MGPAHTQPWSSASVQEKKLLGLILKVNTQDEGAPPLIMGAVR